MGAVRESVLQATLTHSRIQYLERRFYIQPQSTSLILSLSIEWVTPIDISLT